LHEDLEANAVPLLLNDLSSLAGNGDMRATDDSDLGAYSLGFFEQGLGSVVDGR